LVFDPSLAEDVAQETWLAALANAPREGGSLRGWLATIARNLAFRTWRGEDRRAQREMAARTGDGSHMKIYFERSARSKGTERARWWLFTVVKGAV
jgi:DNA-directed RNA polymerase specialized sigma24 family protein